MVCGRKVQAKLRSGHARARTLPRVVGETIPGDNSEPKVAMHGFSKQRKLLVVLRHLSENTYTGKWRLKKSPEGDGPKSRIGAFHPPPDHT